MYFIVVCSDLSRPSIEVLACQCRSRQGTNAAIRKSRHRENPRKQKVSASHITTMKRLICLIALVVSPLAAAIEQWTSAEVTGHDESVVDAGIYTAPMGTGIYATRVQRLIERWNARTSERDIVLEERGRRLVRLVIGESFHYYIDKLRL